MTDPGTHADAQAQAEHADAFEFEFTLKFKLEEDDGLIEWAMKRLERAGSDDALLGASVNGHLEFQFRCRAATAEGALGLAKAAVQRAFPSARLSGMEAAVDTPTAD